MPDLEPITREEMLLDGQDLEPITRKEMFIKRIYDKTLVIPEPITREEMFLKKAGDETTEVTIEQLSVSENGTYSEEGKAYSPVIVNVPAPPIPDNAYLLNEVEELPKDIVTFDDGSNLPMPSLKVGIEPIQSGSGDPSPENIRPISGWSEANVSVCGKNLCDPQIIIDLGATYNNDIFTFAPPNTSKDVNVPLLSGKTITLSYDAYYTTNVVDYYLAIIYTDNTMTRDVTASTANVWKKYTITSDPNKTIKAIRVGIFASAGYTSLKNIQIEEGTTATTYTPYNGHTYNIQFRDGDNPLTVYGVTLDVISGELKVVPYYASYNGETLEGEWISDRDVYAVGTTPTIGAQVVNIGATPQTYQLTPTQVKSLLGSNNVWADTGDIEELEYFSKEV